MSILKMANTDGSHFRELYRIAKQSLLKLEDFGIQDFDAGLC